jgi:hypothetical protein
MNRFLPFLLFISLINFFQQTTAQDYQHQAGIRLGSFDQVVSTGFTYRYHFDSKKAVEAIVNLNERVAIGTLYERFEPFNEVAQLQWFYGAGAYVGFNRTDNVGLLGIIGLDYQFPGTLPVNLSADWKPELNVVKNVSFRASTVAFSIRFSFGANKKQ